MWQDYVFAAGSAVFIIALLPLFLSSVRPPWITSWMNGVVLGAFAFTQHTLDLKWAAGCSAVLSLQWFLLAWQDLNPYERA
ncbi:hypothetical protein [Sinimarinibacterium flocculans]|uniref:hypothetical protein n=1 Tax=Sinimarinibacterium flocculans TaxID=985250 RepID=UPI0024918742|nr:hypothetical protein [Sinimarinibacterium flocculans]